MAPPDSRNGDRPSVQYALKTNKRPQLKTSHSHVGHSHSPSHAHRSSKSASNSVSSSRGPCSVGHAHPPKRSPSTSRHQPQGSGGPAASPNYFDMPVDPSSQSQDSTAVPRESWSPPSSSGRSFGAATPQQLPLDANPEFEAFKRQADANRSPMNFSLGSSHPGGHTVGAPSGTATELLRPRPPRSQTQGSDTMTEAPNALRFPGGLSAKTRRENRDSSSNKMDIDADSNSLHDSAYVSADSKRNSEVSLNTPSCFGRMARRDSPAQFESLFESRSSLSNKVEDRHPRLSLVAVRPETSVFNPKARRAETDPSRADAGGGGPAMMTPAQLKDLIEPVTPQSPTSHVHLLLLDLRVSPQYAKSRIQGALNLCLPTTLLKRSTFNLVKLQQTFQNEHDQEQFAKWPSARYIVVYDASSSEKRDATSAINTLKKFTNESFEGAMYILRGGFNTFASTYPELVAQGPRASTRGAAAGGTLSLMSADSRSRRPSVAPVVGGVMLPGAIHNASNPFFSNIRQNMDLADGVGQMDISVPNGLDASGLPRWLRDAAEAGDHGKRVSDKFLNIELAEQARMENAYSIFNPAVAARTPGPGHVQQQQQQTSDVQLSGLEKGVKNRYKDILPFEHARVRLLGKPEGACDYINASHIKATRSNKRYIASQGPLPATFEDFWSVIWDQGVRVIVMLTAESEGGQLKCHPYWEAKHIGPITLRPLSEKKVSLVIDRYRSSSTFYPVSSMSATSNSSSARERPCPFRSAVAELGRRRANTVTTLDSSTPTAAQPNLASNNSGADSSHGETPFVLIRKFALTHTAHPFAAAREITHLHYPSWPDFGAPAQPSHLLALVELANVMQRAALPTDAPSARASAGIDPHGRRGALKSDSVSSGGSARTTTSSKTDPIPITSHDEPESDARARPMLVHCSAGCGRTGTFCTVDSVIDMLKRQRLRAVGRANEVLAAREQRMRRGMMSSPGRRDADGDVSMDGDVELAPDERFFDFDDDADRDKDEDDVDPISPLSGNPLAAPPPQNPSSATASSFPRHGSDSSAASYTGTSGLSSNASRKVSSTAGTSGPDGEDENDREDEEHGKEVDRLDQSFLDDDGVDLVAHTVEDFRTQRLSMVQSLRQFVLCYETVIEWVRRLQERGGSAGAAITAEGAGGSSSVSRSRARSGTFTG